MNQQKKSRILEVPRHLNDERFDGALAQLLKEKESGTVTYSRAQVTRAIKEGQVLLNGKLVLPRVLVATHDQITLLPQFFAPPQSLEPLVSSESFSMDVLFENEHFLVIDKPAYVQMHAAGMYRGKTVAQWVKEHYPSLVLVGEDPIRPGMVHRLDRDTSGVLLLAKEQETFQVLKKTFQNHQVAKTYLVLVSGHLKELQGEINASLVRRPGELKRRAVDVEKFEGTLPGNTRTALTRYQVLSRYQDYDLILAMPQTGRTHQIRVHLAHLGHPVVGDLLYAFKKSKKDDGVQPKRQLLHAARISFPFSGTTYTFQSPLPQDFRDVLQSIDETMIASYDDEALKSLI